MSDWMDNLLSYCKSGEKGKCPKCHSDMVEVQEFLEGRHHSVTFECLKCKSFAHFDGATKNNKD